MSTLSAPSRWFLAVPLLAAAAFLVLAPPIAQDQAYHSFADQRILLGVPNFWNVISNLGFAIVGALGLARSRDWASRILFMGIFFTAIGSSYYHLAPGDARLIWDRLPMTIVFMSLLSIVIGLWFGERLGRILLLPLLLFGLASIAWWLISGDLRLYGVAQFGPVLIFVPAMYFSKEVRGLWPVVLFYLAAKLAEAYDRQIFSWALLSGHTWKHVLAGLATFWIYLFMSRLWSRECTSAPKGVG